MKIQICDAAGCKNAFEFEGDFDLTSRAGWVEVTEYVERPAPAFLGPLPTPPEPSEIRGEVVVRGEVCPFVLRQPPEAAAEAIRYQDEMEAMHAISKVVDASRHVLCPSCAPKAPAWKSESR